MRPSIAPGTRQRLSRVCLLAVLVLVSCQKSTTDSTPPAAPPPPDTTPPTAPTGFTATPASSSQVNLSWTASTDDVGVTGYFVESCSGTSCSSFAQVASPTGTSFHDTGLAASTSYSYRVRAADAAGNLSGYSGVATTSTPASSVTGVTITPRRGGATLSQTIAFTAAVAGDVGGAGVTWSTTGGSLSGMSATQATFSSSGAGSFTVTATSVVDSSKSASATVGVTDLPGVFTNHNDSQRTGLNAQEYALSPSNLSSSTFGKLFACALDAPGYVYAQPLYVANLTMGDGKKHNVLFVATESDWVYAYDADSSACQQLWKTRVLETGETTVPPADTGETGDLTPEIGVTSTPVIDPATGTLYVCAKAKDGVPDYHHRLYALDLVSGARKLGSPVEITAPNFVPLAHLQRPALLLDNGTVYVAFGSHGDHNTYQGWVMAYNASTLAQKFVWSSTDPTSGNNQGAIWQAGNGPSADSSGNVYVETANGAFDADTGGINYSDSVVKLSPLGSVLDYFTPFDQSTLNTNDVDLGSSGTIVLPDALGSASHPQLALATGKPGTLYLLDRNNLGKFHLSGDQVVQEVAVQPNTTQVVGGMFGQPAVWNGNVYVAAVGDALRQFGIANGALTLVSQSQSANTFGLRGATPVVSAAGTTNGIVWALDISAYPTGAAVLNAYPAASLTTRLYASPSSGTGAAGKAVKFSVPTVANGKVYVAGQAAITVFGLLP